MPESNGYDGDKLERCLTAIDRQDDELDTLKGEYMQRCKGPRERIKELIAAIGENDINLVAFRVLLKKHRSDRRQEKRVAGLEADDADAYELMREALGDFGETELGQAALKRAEGNKALDSLSAG